MAIQIISDKKTAGGYAPPPGGVGYKTGSILTQHWPYRITKMTNPKALHCSTIKSNKIR
jgi:hypothetical protein